MKVELYCSLEHLQLQLTSGSLHTPPRLLTECLQGRGAAGASFDQDEMLVAHFVPCTFLESNTLAELGIEQPDDMSDWLGVLVNHIASISRNTVATPVTTPAPPKSARASARSNPRSVSTSTVKLSPAPISPAEPFSVMKHGARTVRSDSCVDPADASKER